MSERACAATTKQGRPCKATGVLDNGFCMAHQPEEVKESLGFGGAQEGAGRPRAPRMVDLIRERMEDELDAWWQVALDARGAKRAVVVGNGPDAYLAEVEDHPTRLAAWREVMDRAYGKPKQTQEISGPDGGPVSTELVTNPELRAEARALLRRAARPSED